MCLLGNRYDIMRYASCICVHFLFDRCPFARALLRLRLLDLADVDELGLERGATDEETVDVGSLGWGQSAQDKYRDSMGCESEFPLLLRAEQRSSWADIINAGE